MANSRKIQFSKILRIVKLHNLVSTPIIYKDAVQLQTLLSLSIDWQVKVEWKRKDSNHL